MAALKYSRQRESIKEFLRSRTDHPTADTVYENLRQIYPNISLGTVYRNLSLLSDIGEIRKLTNFGSADRYDGRVAPHSHFMCTKCNRVIDMQSDSLNGILEQAAAEFIHGKVFDVDASFYGICKECLKKERSVSMENPPLVQMYEQKAEKIPGKKIKKWQQDESVL